MNIIKKTFQWLLVLLMVALFVRGVVFIFAGSSKDIVSDRENHIAVLDVTGIITEADTLINQFKALEKKNNVKGYILRVNSPGGLVTPSQEIYEYLLTLSKPLYVAMGSTAASGGYMISLPANRIYAMPSTVTGSIGVIMQIPNYTVLMDKVGISQVVIKSGEFKDTGSGNRPMTDAEREVLSAVVMDMYDQFVQSVSTRRNMSLEEAKTLADGRIYTGRMAQESGLIDRLGSWSDALTEMKQDLNMPNLKYIEIADDPANFWKRMFSKTPALFGAIQSAPRFQAGGFYFMMDM